ncbi:MULTISPECIES: hypothetical protein, partial [unclassified Bradyrhizobium]
GKQAGLIPALAGFECAIRHQPNRTSTPGKAEFLPSLDGQITESLSIPRTKNNPLSPSGKSVI